MAFAIFEPAILAVLLAGAFVIISDCRVLAQAA